MKTLIIIPAYNEEKNIVKVIESLKSENSKWDIVVINDGSSDNTSTNAKSTNSAYVINLPCNLGIGGAVQTGFKFAKKYDYDIAIQFDGDCQHIASEIPKLINLIQDDSCDVAIGSRFIKGNKGWKSTFARRIGIKIIGIVSYLLIHQKITDSTSGFRAYNKKAIHFLAENYPYDYPEPEAVILLGKNGLRMKEVYTDMIQRQGGRSSINGLNAAYYMIKVLLAIFLVNIRPKIYGK